MHKIKNIKSKLVKKASTLHLRHKKENINNEDSVVELTFRLKKTQEDFPNEIIHICGSLPELGNNSAEKSPAMIRDESGMWVYTIRVTLGTLESKRIELSNTFQGNPSGHFFTFNYISFSNENGRSVMKYEEIPKRGLLKSPLLKESSSDRTLVSSLDSNSESYRDKVILDQEWNVNDEIIVKPEIPIPESISNMEEVEKPVESVQPIQSEPITTSITESSKGKEELIAFSPTPIANNELSEISTSNGTVGDANVLRSSLESWQTIDDTSLSTNNNTNINDFNTTTTSSSSSKDKLFDWYHTITGKSTDNSNESSEEKKLKKAEEKIFKKRVKEIKEEQKQKEKEEKKLNKEIKKQNKMRASQEAVIIDKNETIPSTINFNEVDQSVSQPRSISSEAISINVTQDDTPSEIQVIQEMQFVPIPKKRSMSKEEIRAEENICEQRRKEESDRILNRQLKEKSNYDKIRNSNDNLKIIEHATSYSLSDYDENENQTVLTPKAEKKEFNLDEDQLVEPVDQDKIVYHTQQQDEVKVSESEAMMEKNIENLVSEFSTGFSAPPKTPILEKAINTDSEIISENSKNLPIGTIKSSEDIEKLERESIERLKSFEMNPNFNVESTPQVRLTNTKEFKETPLQIFPIINQLPMPFSENNGSESDFLEKDKNSSSVYTLLSYDDIDEIKRSENVVNDIDEIVRQEEKEQLETEIQLRQVEELLEETEPLLAQIKEEEQEIEIEKEMIKEDFMLKKDEVETERLLNRSNQIIQDTEDLIAKEDSIETDRQLDEANEIIQEGEDAIINKVLSQEVNISLPSPLMPDRSNEIEASQIHVRNEPSFSGKSTPIPTPLNERVHDDLENKLEKSIEDSGIKETENTQPVVESNPEPEVIELVENKEKMVSVFEELSNKGKETLRRPVWSATTAKREGGEVTQSLEDTKEEIKEKFEMKKEELKFEATKSFENALTPLVNISNNLQDYGLSLRSATVVGVAMGISLFYMFAMPESFTIS